MLAHVPGTLYGVARAESKLALAFIECQLMIELERIFYVYYSSTLSRTWRRYIGMQTNIVAGTSPSELIWKPWKKNPS